MKNIIFRKSGMKMLLVFAFVRAGTVVAQKLPSVQSVVKELPPNTVIDGKADEWNNNFQAYNKSSNVFYTVAHSEERFYMVIRATNRSIMKKIISGGITLTIDPNGKRHDDNAVKLTFPVLTTSEQSMIANALNQTTGADKETTDAVLELANEALTKSVKTIRMSQAAGQPDTSLSIYNRLGFKAAVKFDAEGALIIELALPRKTVDASDGKVIAYNIMLNGFAANTVKASPKLVGVASVTYIPRGISTKGNSDFNTINFPTDFWGTYQF
jgi:hypothetical protein